MESWSCLLTDASVYNFECFWHNSLQLHLHRSLTSPLSKSWLFCSKLRRFWVYEREVCSDFVTMEPQGTVSTGNITCGAWGVILSDSAEDSPPFGSTDLCTNPKSVDDVSALLEHNSCAGSVF